MKNWSLVLRGLRLFALAFSFVSILPPAFAQGTTAFTYQGQLRDGGTNANGNYSLVFKLHDALTSGNQVGPTVTLASQFITNGQFNASLDFGAVFEGSARWLEISVEGNLLTPRTLLAPTPYALHAAKAGSVSNPTFLGTTGNTPLDFYVNSLRALRLEPNATSPNFIGGYPGNTVTNGFFGSTIVGGGAGQDEEDGLPAANTIGADFAFIGGGARNTVTGPGGVIAGGFGNLVSDDSSAIVGGGGNTVTGDESFVGAGSHNLVSGNSAVVTGGRDNLASSNGAFIGGGQSNTVAGFFAMVGGGSGNAANNSYGTVVGGLGNQATSQSAFIGGGVSNKVTGFYGTISRGDGNLATDYLGFIGGGQSNRANGFSATVAGGTFNAALNHAAAIGGGKSNLVSGDFSTIAGGQNNTVLSDRSFIGGGQLNTASQIYAVVGGGSDNGATGIHSVVGGGQGNTASGNDSFVGGGSQNVASGGSAVVAGGLDNIAAGNQSFAGGTHARAAHDGSFVWASGAGTTFSSAVDNEFAARAIQFRFYVSDLSSLRVIPGGTTVTGTFQLNGGMNVTSGATFGANVNAPSFNGSSDRNAKQDFAEVNGREVLAKVVAMPIQMWNYKQDAATRHIGPMAQDFHAAFGVGIDEKHIATVDADGVALAAIQGLNEVVKEKDAKIAALQQRLESLEKAVSALVQKQNGGAQ